MRYFPLLMISRRMSSTAGGDSTRGPCRNGRSTIMKRLWLVLGVSVLLLVPTGVAVATPSAQPAAPPTPVKHVVILYLENHAFDNVLGYWCNSQPGRCPAGGMPASVTLSNGTVVTPGVTP